MSRSSSSPRSPGGCSGGRRSACRSARSARTPRPPTRRASTSHASATSALMLGGALMAVGGAFLTLAVLGTFTLDIIAGRGWVCIALVIFGRWRIWRGVAGRAHLLGGVLAGAAAPDHGGLRVAAAGDHAGAAVSRGHRRARALGPQRALSGRLPEALSSGLTSPRPTDGRSTHGRPGCMAVAIEQAAKSLSRAACPSVRRSSRTDRSWASATTGASSRAASSATARRTASRTSAGCTRRSIDAPRCTRRSRRATCAPARSCMYGIPRVVIGENRTFLGGEDLPALPRGRGREPRFGRVLRSSCRRSSRATPRSGTRTSARSDAPSGGRHGSDRRRPDGRPTTRSADAPVSLPSRGPR